MTAVQSLIRRVQKTQHGFTDIQKASEEVLLALSPVQALKLARELFSSDIHQARILATFLFGRLAARSKASLTFLRKRVSLDGDWRVQEILAQAFDRYCKDLGYAKALPVIEDWLGDANANVRRAMTEGLRIWTTRDYFHEHPERAIRLLGRLRADESEYVRKSVGNALRDISRRHADAVAVELAGWNLSDRRIQQTHKLAGGFLR